VGVDAEPEGPNHEPISDTRMTDMERRAFDLVNELRRREGLPGLAIATNLIPVARGHSEYMARYGFFGHVTPGGQGPADRVNEAGIPFAYVGENLARNSGYADPAAEAARSWSQNATHWDVLINPVYEAAAVGVARASNGMWYFTQIFIQRPSG
jgi:uncharacterized protein YkwD